MKLEVIQGEQTPKTPTMEKYIVVSFDGIQWGIEGDFYANDESSAIRQGSQKYQRLKSEDEQERGDFKAFKAKSKELEEFIYNHNFVNED